jgi:preprotein translocase subunit SecG
MGILNVVLLVVFIIIAVLLILLILIQNEEGDGLGGIFTGGSSSAFGSRSGNILSRASGVLGAIFLILSFSLALINRSPSTSGIEREGQAASRDQENGWWKSEEPIGELRQAQPEGESAEGSSAPASSTGSDDSQAQ